MTELFYFHPYCFFELDLIDLDSEQLVFEIFVESKLITVIDVDSLFIK